VTLAGFMLFEAHECLFVAESGGKFLGICEVSATVVPYVENHSIAQSKIAHHLVEIAFADAACETPVVNIADIVVEDGISQS
jgi:hypothetical protein